MGKGRLLASVCALGLIVAAPAFAQTTSPPGSTGGHIMTRGNENNSAAHEMMTHRRTGRRSAIRRTTRTGADTSQNAAVDRLNDQSLDAARRGTPFMNSNDNAPAQGGGGAPPSPAGNTKM